MSTSNIPDLVHSLPSSHDDFPVRVKCEPPTISEMEIACGGPVDLSGYVEDVQGPTLAIEPTACSNDGANIRAKLGIGGEYDAHLSNCMENLVTSRFV